MERKIRRIQGIEKDDVLVKDVVNINLQTKKGSKGYTSRQLIAAELNNFHVITKKKGTVSKVTYLCE